MTSQSTTHRAIICITGGKKISARVNYARRMYAIARRYTPNAIEGEVNTCYAELTGLRTFFKMSYTELAETIRMDIERELGIICSVNVASARNYDQLVTYSKKSKTISTYKEINKLFAGKSYVEESVRSVTKKTVRNNKVIKRVRLIVPFLGKVN